MRDGCAEIERCVAAAGGAVTGFVLWLLPQISPATRANVAVSLRALAFEHWGGLLTALACGAGGMTAVCVAARAAAGRRGLRAPHLGRAFGFLLFPLVSLLWFTPFRAANFQMLVVIVFIASVAACASRLAAMLHIPALADGDRLCRASVVLLMVVHFAIFSFLSVSKFNRLQCDMYDLGIHDSMTWHATQGRFFRDFRGPYDHFSPIVLTYVPVYLIWPSPKALLVVQSLVVALGCWPLYQLARLRLRSPTAGVVTAAAYLLYPFVSRVHLYDFHPMLFVPPIFFAACLELWRGRTCRFLAWVVVCLCVKEVVAVLVFGLGLFVALGARRWRLGIAVCLLAVAWSIWVTQIYFPALIGAEYPHYGRYRTVLDGDAGLVSGLRDRTAFAIRSHFIWRTVLLVLVPLGLLPLASASGFVFLAGVPMAMQFLSENTPQQLLKAHYSAAVIAGTLVAAVYGIEVFARGGDRRHRLRIALVFLLVSAVLSNYFFGDPPFERYAHNDVVNYDVGFHGRLFSLSLEWDMYRPGRHEEVFHALCRLLPSDASVMAQDNLACHVSQRRTISLPLPGQDHDFYLHDARTYFPGGNDARNKQVHEEILARPDYTPFFMWDGYQFFACGDRWREVVSAGAARIREKPDDTATRLLVARILSERGEPGQGGEAR